LIRKQLDKIQKQTTEVVTIQDAISNRLTELEEERDKGKQENRGFFFLGLLIGILSGILSDFFVSFWFQPPTSLTFLGLGITGITLSIVIGIIRYHTSRSLGKTRRD
jgi:hypothetical protein